VAGALAGSAAQTAPVPGRASIAQSAKAGIFLTHSV